MSSNVPHVPKSNLSNRVQVSFAFYTEITQIYEFSIIKQYQRKTLVFKISGLYLYHLFSRCGHDLIF